MLWLANLSNDLVNELDDGLVYFVSLVDRLDHLRLWDLIRASLDHDNFLSGRSDSQV